MSEVAIVFISTHAHEKDKILKIHLKIIIFILLASCHREFQKSKKK